MITVRIIVENHGTAKPWDEIVDRPFNSFDEAKAFAEGMLFAMQDDYTILLCYGRDFISEYRIGPGEPCVECGGTGLSEQCLECGEWLCKFGGCDNCECARIEGGA